MSNPLVELTKLGQSIWYDQMERKLLSSGRLQKMIDDDDLRGLTSNPTIFEKAIAGSDDYDAQLGELAVAGRSRDDIYDELVLQDIAGAADVFRPVYDRTGGNDGFVSIEVSPLLALDTAGTISEAKRMHGRLNRPNVMIKIPATPEGIPAIEEVIAAGINVNITLIFSNEVYKQVMEAYLRGLERRVAQNLPVGDINSVASFFVSRIDSAADKQIEAKLASDPSVESLLGKVAIANAKLAYQEFKNVFGSDRFAKLRDKGAKVQRPLWASTGTKNPKYSDVLYIDSLIGADTVNTVPPATYEAYRDHGQPELRLEADVDEARKVLDTFAAKGFSLDAITKKLTDDGVKSFGESFGSLAQTIEARRDAAVRKLSDRITYHLGSSQQAADSAIARADKDKAVERIWKKDASLWKPNDEAHAKIIGNALGWLNVADEMSKHIDELMAFAKSVEGEFDFVVVLGMGGSSLCSEVTARVFNVGPMKEGRGPKLLVLDSTVPDAVAALEAQLDLARTLFVVASKSGTTTEPVMFHRYFYDRVKSVKGDKAGQNFVAVTDPGTQMLKDAERDSFRKIFINYADIGGRYSALSYFGMVPAAIAGVDVKSLLDRAAHTAHLTSIPAVAKNPAAKLGAAIGGFALAGRNKLTLITPKPFDTLGLWVEQLVAESTGKEGKGIVPIAGEPALDAKAYGNDRLFVSVRLAGSDDARVLELAAAGHPVIDYVVPEALDLGEVFFVFEFATAVAGAILGIDAFDQPNVQESKDNTKRLLDEFKSTGGMKTDTKQIQVSDDGAITTLLAKVKAGDYVALTEYFSESSVRNERIAAIRAAIAERFGVATTTGYGPRFLHSTGQLHKGGADNGVFIQLTGGSGSDVAIPAEPFGFGVLVRAQAIGDFESLASRNRRAISIDLGTDVDGGLQTLESIVSRATAKA